MPDTNVFATARGNESAFVWWISEDEDVLENGESILGWDILRYRQNPGVESSMEWGFKGKTFVEGGDRRSALVTGLAEGRLYRFSVKAIFDKKAPGVESPMCDPLVVENPLPNGWIRLYDTESGRFYYSNWRSRVSKWVRPDLDTYFIDDGLGLIFSGHEISSLREKFEQLLQRYGIIDPKVFVSDVLSFVGEYSPESDVKALFMHFIRNANDGTSLAVRTWYEFMLILHYFKIEGIKRMDSSLQRFLRAAHNKFVDMIVNGDNGKARRRKYKSRTSKLNRIIERSSDAPHKSNLVFSFMYNIVLSREQGGW
jgi:WW domain